MKAPHVGAFADSCLMEIEMSGSFTQIEKKPGTVGAGDFVMTTAAKGRGDTAPKNVVPVNTDSVSVGKNRMRGVDKATVDRLYEDISRHGLLQPIGVQQSKDAPGVYTVIYGVHRYLAFKRGWEEAKRLLAERGDQDAEAYGLARIWQLIPAIVYDSAMPVDYALLKELTENMMRMELSKPERAVHETRYTHLVKKLGLVVTAGEKSSLTQKGKSKRKGEPVGQNVPQVQDVEVKQTATEKVTADLGITRKDLNRSHGKVNDLAKAVARDEGLPEPVTITPETAATPEAENTIALAERGAQAKVEAEKQGKDQRKVHAKRVTPDEEILVRVDVTDPQQLLSWFRLRLKDAKKPMTVTYLQGLHRGLGDLISEKIVEANKR